MTGSLTNFGLLQISFEWEICNLYKCLVAVMKKLLPASISNVSINPVITLIISFASNSLGLFGVNSNEFTDFDK